MQCLESILFCLHSHSDLGRRLEDGALRITPSTKLAQSKLAVMSAELAKNHHLRERYRTYATGAQRCHKRDAVLLSSAAELDTAGPLSIAVQHCFSMQAKASRRLGLQTKRAPKKQRHKPSSSPACLHTGSPCCLSVKLAAASYRRAAASQDGLSQTYARMFLAKRSCCAEHCTAVRHTFCKRAMADQPGELPVAQHKSADRRLHGSPSQPRLLG